MVVYYSTDGESFEVVDLGVPGKLNDVAYGDGRYVAIGSGGSLFTSPDGAKWTTQDSGVTLNLVSVTHGNGRFVVVAGFGSPLLESSDGVTWTSPLSDDTFFPRTVAFGNGVFLVAGNRLMTSANGNDWTDQPTVPEGFVRRLSFLDGRFVGVGNSAIQSSQLGESWTKHNSATVLTLNDITFDGSSLVVVGQNRTGGTPVILQSVGGVVARPSIVNPRRLPSGTFEFDVAAPVSTEITVRATSDFEVWDVLNTIPINENPTVFSDPTAIGIPFRAYQVIVEE
jgi:hypothetical protein